MLKPNHINEQRTKKLRSKGSIYASIILLLLLGIYELITNISPGRLNHLQTSDSEAKATHVDAVDATPEPSYFPTRAPKGEGAKADSAAKGVDNDFDDDETNEPTYFRTKSPLLRSVNSNSDSSTTEATYTNVIGRSASDVLVDENETKLTGASEWNKNWLSAFNKENEPTSQTPININPNSTVASDISSLYHNPQRSEICIQFKQDSRCPRPSLVGRLSGKSIAILHWKESPTYLSTTRRSFGTTFCGSYNNAWLMPGTYFLEITIMHCNGFGLPALDKILSENHTEMDLQNWRSYDFTNECVEDPNRHRITADDAYITITKTSSGEGLGLWVLANGTQHNDENLITSPWFTRWQPQGCLPHNATGPYCTVPMDNSRIEEYTFAWTEQDWIHNISSLQVDLGITSPADIYSVGTKYSTPISSEWDAKSTEYANDGRYPNNVYKLDVFYGPNKICLVGDSHSWHLIKALYRLNLGHHFVFIEVLFPSGSSDHFETWYTKRNCTSFVIALGQWPLSFMAPGGRPVTAENFRKGILQMVGNEEVYKIGKGDIKIYLQNVHHDPLGFAMNGCNNGKPVDWRSYTSTDMYNYVVEGIVEEVKNNNPLLKDRIEYVDTQFITTAFWDTAPDWYHLHYQVADVEALYYARKFLLH